MEARVAEQLVLLHDYAQAVAYGIRLEPSRVDLIATGHAYIGGALTTMLNLGLLTEAEYSEWAQRIEAEMPSDGTTTIG